MIDRETIDKILDATNIVDVVSEFVTLRKSGVNYKGLCPFHDDKTPSFMVSPTKQICKCFSCGEGGTAINFLMKHEQITYPEALRWLAKKYNIEIQEKELTDEEKREQETRPFRKIDDSFRKIIVTRDTAHPWYDENGILTVSIYDFLLDWTILE